MFDELSISLFGLWRGSILNLSIFSKSSLALRLAHGTRPRSCNTTLSAQSFKCFIELVLLNLSKASWRKMLKRMYLIVSFNLLDVVLHKFRVLWRQCSCQTACRKLLTPIKNQQTTYNCCSRPCIISTFVLYKWTMKTPEAKLSAFCQKGCYN